MSSDVIASLKDYDKFTKDIKDIQKAMNRKKYKNPDKKDLLKCVICKKKYFQRQNAHVHNKSKIHNKNLLRMYNQLYGPENHERYEDYLG